MLARDLSSRARNRPCRENDLVDSVGNDRVEVHQHAQPYQRAADEQEGEERRGMGPGHGESLDGEAETHQKPRELQAARQPGTGPGHGLPSFHIFTPARPWTLWIVSWHSRQEVAFFASSARTSLCRSLSSNDLAPAWQCRHSRLL